MTIEDFLGRFEGVRKNASGWTARCPAHDDRRQSLSISQGEKGIVLKCFAGCETKRRSREARVEGTRSLPAREGAGTRLVLGQKIGQARSDLSVPKRARPSPVRVLRFPGKDFRQRRPDPSRPGAYVYNLDGVSRVPYRLPELPAG